MTSTINTTPTITTLPDHTQLPESDGTFVKNLQEHPQSILLTITPILQRRHPKGDYCIGQDSGIYWRLTDPPERGAEAPDWFYVPNVPPAIDGRMRRSYVLWQELISPLIVLEFVSGDGSEERDRTPLLRIIPEERKPGKFWIYENVIRPAFYGIYEVRLARIELYHLIEDRYQFVPENERGNYSIAPLEVELGIWQGRYQNVELPWLRWWDSQGNLLLTGEERAELAQSQLELLRSQLRAAGIEPQV
jgi:Uma2 family endonuclease